jgi:hypothetical protein
MHNLNACPLCHAPQVHFILRHKNPVSGEWEEKHLVTPPVPDTMDKLTHLYTAIM